MLQQNQNPLYEGERENEYQVGTGSPCHVNFNVVVIAVITVVILKLSSFSAVKFPETESIERESLSLSLLKHFLTLSTSILKIAPEEYANSRLTYIAVGRVLF